MPNPYFQFKKFTIHQERCAMKVGTDGVLLGAWIDINGAKRILDVGTGTGLIALMIAQRSDALIDAVEIDESAADQAMENVANSMWASRIHIHFNSFQNFSNTDIKYDIIVSNPPYFTDCLPAPESKRSLARHNDQLSLKELVDGVVRLLSQLGRFSVILPANEYEIFRELALKLNLNENRRTIVYPSPGKDVKRILSEFAFYQKEFIENSIVIEKYGRHQYSGEFIELTRNYYLKH
jgi:tRNA1Val (adenine37-N6)-methyltransferase